MEVEEIDPEIEMQRELIKRLYYGVGNKDESSYKYFNRGIWAEAQDFKIKIGKPIGNTLSQTDKYLRKF